MPYATIQDFRLGLDRRKRRATGIPGSLWECTNAHISRGGEIEKRKAFVAKYALPAGTFGLQSNGTTLYAFGSIAPPSMPSGISYQQLIAPGTPSMTAVLDSCSFAGNTYVIATYSDGTTHHFSNAVRVTDWDGGANKPASKGIVCRTYKSKVHSLYGTTWWQSKTNTPATFDSTQTGSGFQDLSQSDEFSASLTAMTPYQTSMAFFSRNNVQLWNVDVDPTKNVFVQTIGNTGTRANKSAVTVGNTDVYYLSDSGIRSLRARDASNAAYVNDVGTPIDPLVTEALRNLDAATTAAAAGIVEPIDGRFMLSIGSNVYTFSYFPGAKISAWSVYSPGFTITNWSLHLQGVYARSGDTVYKYGGDDNNTYDSSTVTVTTPFMTLNRVEDDKYITGYDIAVEGTWDVYLLSDPRDENVQVKLGTVTGFTYVLQALGAVTSTPVFALKLVNQSSGAAWIGNLTVTYDKIVP